MYFCKVNLVVDLREPWHSSQRTSHPPRKRGQANLLSTRSDSHLRSDSAVYQRRNEQFFTCYNGNGPHNVIH